MGPVMKFNQYIRRPFVVEAVEITEENIDEVAELVGEIRVKDGVKFIALNRRIVPNVNRAYIGWFMTRMNDNYRCYNPKTFNEQFIDHEPVKSFVFGGVEDEFDATPPHGIERQEMHVVPLSVVE